MTNGSLSSSELKGNVCRLLTNESILTANRLFHLKRTASFPLNFGWKEYPKTQAVEFTEYKEFAILDGKVMASSTIQAF
jgi:hypothetical protein